MVLYDENSVCPRCGGKLWLRLFQKGFRLRCKKCRFKVYPPIEQISEDLIQRHVERCTSPTPKEVHDHLALKYDSVAVFLKQLKKEKDAE